MRERNQCGRNRVPNADWRRTVRDIPVGRITDVLGDVMYGTMFTNYFAGRGRIAARAGARHPGHST